MHPVPSGQANLKHSWADIFEPPHVVSYILNARRKDEFSTLFLHPLITAGGQVFDGATLMRDGLVPPCHNEFDSSIIELVSENK